MDRTRRELDDCQQLIAQIRLDIQTANDVGDFEEVDRLERQLRNVFVWADHIIADEVNK